MFDFDVDSLRLVFALDWCLRNYDGKAFTVQTHSAKFDFGPYVQAQYLDDVIEIEITSNRYLRPNISQFDQQRLESLGWNAPSCDDELDHPNYWAEFPCTPEGYMAAAQLWVRSLDLVFDLPFQAKYEIAPITIDMLREIGKLLYPTPVPAKFVLWNRHRAEASRRRATEASPAENSGTVNPEHSSTNPEGARVVKTKPGSSGTTKLRNGRVIEPARTKQQIERRAMLEKERIWNIKRVLVRGLELQMHGTDLIRLATSMGDNEAVQGVRDLVYGVTWLPELNLKDEWYERLGLYPPADNLRAS